MKVSVFGLSRRFRISAHPKWEFSLDLKKWFTSRAKGKTLHLCCGYTYFDFAVNVDIDPKSRADIIADMFHLPFRSNVFDTIICDPPYRLAIHRRPFWVKEMFRVLKKQSGSRVLLKTDFIPYFGPNVELKELIIYQGRRYWCPISLLLHYEVKETLDPLLQPTKP